MGEGATSFLRTRRGQAGGTRVLGTPDAVSRFQNGDPETVEAVRHLIRDVLRAHSTELKPYWDDLVLEVCAQAWQRARREGEGIQNLEGLVARMAHARVIDLHRYRSRWRLEGGSDARLASIPDPDLGPYENLNREESARLVGAMIAAVDDRTRTIWRMLYYEGLKYREAALRLGVPEGTLKRLVHESLRAASKRFAGIGSIAADERGRQAGGK
ncbi:MAG TPA: sigma-70 family RNA polymerase sigma factor [Candidatus Cryosericum sp.]|nr:sigma-70 family RNA polymerase sigma factor [Candidatus Cryosericum sp.]